MKMYGVASVLFLLVTQNFGSMIPEFQPKDFKLGTDFFPETARDVIVHPGSDSKQNHLNMIPKDFKLGYDFYPETARDVIVRGLDLADPFGNLRKMTHSPAKNFKLGNDFSPETARDVIVPTIYNIINIIKK